MPTATMIDMETLSTSTDTVILSIGIVKFDPVKREILDTLEVKPTIDEQTEQFNRTISEDTLKWWAQQNPDAINEALGDEGRIPFREALEQCRKFCINTDRVWSNGSCFDIMIMEHAFKQLDMICPWQFYKIRDCRTIYELTGLSLKKTDHATRTSHKALEDAIHQTNVIFDAYNILQNKGVPVNFR